MLHINPFQRFSAFCICSRVFKEVKFLKMMLESLFVLLPSRLNVVLTIPVHSFVLFLLRLSQ